MSRLLPVACLSILAAGCAGFDVDNGSASDAAPAEVGLHADAPTRGESGGMEGGRSAALDAGHDARMTSSGEAGHSLPDATEDTRQADVLQPHDTSVSTGQDAAPVDAGLDAGPVVCGTVTCPGGESCVNGGCELVGCSGLHVPGDYVRVIDAVGALPVGGGTICIGPGTFDEDVQLEAMGPVTLQGVSASMSDVHIVNATSSSLTVIALQIDFLEAYVGATAQTLTVTASTLGNVQQGLTACELIVEGGSLNATFDGVEMIGLAESSPELQVYQSGDSTLELTLENSYLHAGPNGLIYTGSADGGAPKATIVVENNTFVDNGNDGILIDPVGNVTATVFNNILYNNGTGITVSVQGPYGSNALYDNGMNYGGSWGAQASDVLTDPMLDDSVDPPGLLAGSPCRGAGDPTHAPAYDFYGRARGSSPDIGAVQSSP